MKRIVFLVAGPYIAPGGYPICVDSDHNRLNEIIFFTDFPTRWEIWEYRPINQYQLVYIDSGIYPYPPGIESGNFSPYDVGDIDQDSLFDLLGPNRECVLDTIYHVVTTQESPSYFSYPETLSWWHRTSDLASGHAFYFTDLDQDDKREALLWEAWDSSRIMIIENIGNNQNVPVWRRVSNGSMFAFDDFDRDGRTELVTASAGSMGQVFVFENVGDNQYEKVFTDTVRIPNGVDVFSGNDLDGDGRPEFFVGFAQYVGGNNWDFYLYMWEATGNNTYQRNLIAQRRITAISSTGRRSKCGDIDGDSIEELVWATPTTVYAFEATGNNQFTQIWQWTGDHGNYEELDANIYDMNQNGYNEIVITGSNRTSLFEVEAVWLRRPNGGETFIGNTQEPIRWQKFYPPRCDSLSLFYSLDNGRTYDTIITSLPGADSSYLWTVPDTSSDSCKIKIIAYGPGWQFDETDGVFTISLSGINEIASPSLAMTSIKITPNLFKSQTTICYTLPFAQNIRLRLFDITGKLVKVFCDGYKESGIYKINLKAKEFSSGIYFIRFQTESSKSIIERLVIVK